MEEGNFTTRRSRGREAMLAKLASANTPVNIELSLVLMSVIGAYLDGDVFAYHGI